MSDGGSPLRGAPRRLIAIVAWVAFGIAGGSTSARADSSDTTVLPALSVQGGELDLAMIPADKAGTHVASIRVIMAVPGTPAYNAGIRNGDQLVMINGKPVRSYSIADFLPPTDLLGSGCAAVFLETHTFRKATYVAVSFAKRK